MSFVNINSKQGMDLNISDKTFIKLGKNLLNLELGRVLILDTKNMFHKRKNIIN